MPFSILEAKPLLAETFKVGVEGWPVIVCQNALNSHYSTPPLTLDGVFGPRSEQIAKEVQAACHVTPDGVVGPITQHAFVAAKCVHAEKGMTPPGLLIGMCNIESSYQWACVSIENENGTHDYGPTQISLPARRSEAELLRAFNPDIAAHILAGEVRAIHNSLLSKVSDRRAWELAALDHNWPVAVFKIANGEEAWLDKPFAFTTADGYATGLDYVRHYVSVATAQVTSWTVA